MDNESEISEKELSFYHLLDEEISERVNQEIEVKIHHGSTEIDEAGLREKYTKQVFQELNNPIESIIREIIRFYDLLKEDDLEIYEEVKLAGGNDQNIDANDFSNLINRGTEKNVSDELLKKVYEIGVRHYSSSDFEKALPYFTWLCAKDPKNLQMWFMKGIVEQNLQNYQQALVTYNYIITLDSGFTPVYAQLINCLILLGNLDEARTIYESFIGEVDQSSYAGDISFIENLKIIKEVLG